MAEKIKKIKSMWLVSHRDGLSVSRQSPIQVVTGPSVEQRCVLTKDKMLTNMPCAI